MSTEIDELEKRVAAVEKSLAGWIATELARNPLNAMCAAEPAPCSDAEHPPVGYRIAGKSEKRPEHYLFWNDSQRCIPHAWSSSDGTLIGQEIEACARIAVPIPANEGDSRLAESVAIPVGWKECCFFDHANSRAFGGTFIAPDPSIPWGEGYEAILPSEAKPGDFALVQFGDDATTARDEWTAYEVIKSWCRDTLAWRRRIPATTPTEPARDLSAEVGRLEEWQEAGLTASMMWDVIQAMRKTLDCDGTTTPVERAERVMRTIDELRATVEMLEAELRAANHRADIAENEEVYSLKRANERMKLALERIASVDARDGSEYALICEMRKTAREALG